MTHKVHYFVSLSLRGSLFQCFLSGMVSFCLFSYPISTFTNSVVHTYTQSKSLTRRLASCPKGMLTFLTSQFWQSFQVDLRAFSCDKCTVMSRVSYLLVRTYVVLCTYYFCTSSYAKLQNNVFIYCLK